MRLTIARKIALAVIAIVILCFGTMAWVTSVNLQRGFVAYLNRMQMNDVEQLGQLVAKRYRQEGDMEWLRRRPPAMRELMGQLSSTLRPEGVPEHHPPPRHGDGPPGDWRGHEGPPGMRSPPGARDAMNIGPRVSIVDPDGAPLAGPPYVPNAIEHAVVVDGKTIATILLRPLRQGADGSDSAAGFLRQQVRDIVIVAVLMGLVSILLALWLARHLLRPVAALRDVTARLARGQFDARAPLLSRDELAELALHVNAMAQALEVNEQQRRRMLADVAHELRTPLTVIRGEIEALIDGIRDAGPDALASLHAEVLHLNKLVDDLHQLSLADAGDLHIEWAAVPLAELLRPLALRFRDRAAGAGLGFEWDGGEDGLVVRADEVRLNQIVVNLLENSVRYTDHGGRIMLALAREGHHACISVDDSAPGVPAGSHEQIFERLYRIDTARTRERGGSGLGLAICKALAEAQGGRMTAAPSPLGGLRITLRLPLEQAAR